MKQPDFFRMAFVLSEGQAKTFKKNLEKIIKLVLSDCYGESISIAEIVLRAEKEYNLMFSVSEIEDVIRTSNPQDFIKTEKKDQETLFTITPKAYQNIRKHEDINTIEVCIKKFLQNCNDGCPFSEKDFEKLVCRYVYDSFNTNIETVLALMNYQTCQLEMGQANGYTTEEVEWINLFLNWEDANKNYIIYRLISSCYEFCMMTIKKDNKSFASIFRGKEFFLDTNIIFRLVGFNNKEREAVVTAFVKKCKECGIKLKYTNYTNDEINNTLAYQVNLIKKLFNKGEPISIESIRTLGGDYVNLDFYWQYVNWTKRIENEAGDYAGFQKFLERKIHKALHKMQMVTFESFDKPYKEQNFKMICEDLENYKNNRYKHTYYKSIECDIENYLYMKLLDRKTKYNSFVDKNYYFITADHTLIDWSKEQMPGAIPTFVLPSVWYSLMLKYSGRTDDDYGAFCQFLKLSTTYGLEETKEQQEQKIKMLAYILEINEKIDIKEQIIFDIGQRLSHEGNKEIGDIEEFVEESHQNIVEKEVNKAVKAKEQEHQADKKQIEYQHQEALEQQHQEGREEGIREARKQHRLSYKEIRKSGEEPSR